MTDPRIALADRLAELADYFFDAPEAHAAVAINVPEQRKELVDCLYLAVSALRAIQPETGLRERTIEECAKVADDYYVPEGQSEDYSSGFIDAKIFAAEAIRALSTDEGIKK